MSDDDKIITFESYYDVMRAHIIRSRLEDNGIQCFIADENMVGTNPLFNQAAGGVKLKIFEKDLNRCREVLATEPGLHEYTHSEINENTYVVCPQCASTDVVNIAGADTGVFTSFMNLLNPFYTQNNWHCNNCQHDFE